MISEIKDFDDPRIAAYRNLKDKQLALDHNLFVVEGEFLVRRLLASPFSVHSLLMTASRYESGHRNIPSDGQVYLAAKEVISKIVGFDFHRGVLALGHRPLRQKIWNYANIDKIDRLIVCPEINDVENLGSMMRTAAGLGYEHFLLGESCCDPFARRAIRTSMGAAFTLKIFQSTNIVKDLKKLKSECNFEWHATVLDDNAETLDQITVPIKLGLLFGSEANGLPDSILQVVDHRVTIPMQLGSDSLNVSVAVGIFLYHYRE